VLEGSVENIEDLNKEDMLFIWIKKSPDIIKYMK